MDILITRMDAYQHRRWKGQPLYQNFERIRSYLAIKLGEEYANLLASPKTQTDNYGKELIVWRTEKFDVLPRSLADLTQGTEENRQLAEWVQNKLRRMEVFVEELSVSESADDHTWGELLRACFKDLDHAFVFLNGSQVVVAGWGLSPLTPVEITPFSALRSSVPKRAKSDEQPQVHSDAEDANPITPDENEIQGAVDTEPKDSADMNQEEETSGAHHHGNAYNEATSPEMANHEEAPESTIVEEQGDREDSTNTSTHEPDKDDSHPSSPRNIRHAPNPHSDVTKSDMAHPKEDTKSHTHNTAESPNYESATKADVEAGNVSRNTSSGDDGPPGASRKPRWSFPPFGMSWWLWLLLLLLIGIFVWRTCTPTQVVYLPPSPGVIIPIDSTNIVVDDDSLRMVVGDRINIALRGDNKDLDAFAKAFKTAYPDPVFQIIYYDTLIHRIQVSVPANRRTELTKEIPSKLPDFEMLIWHESIFDREALPSDPGFSDRSKSWYIEAIGAAQAWGRSFGEKNVVVAIIDDGFDLSHVEFADKIVKPWNVLERSSRVFSHAERLKHGSHVAGTAVAKRDNAAGLAGIAPDCKLMPIQVSDMSGLISMTAVVDGILYAVNQGADVINLSLGMKVHPLVSTLPVNIQRDIIANSFQEEALFWQEIYNIAEENGVTVVLAGGNDNVLIGLDPMQRSPLAIKVSALTPNLIKAPFSNYGEFSTLSAPGVGIYSSVPNNRYEFMDGTSMAAPIVTGAVALLKSTRSDLTPADIRNLLVNTARPVPGMIGPLLQLNHAMDRINDQSALDDPDLLNCDNIARQIDSLLQRIEWLRKRCPDAGVDTMKMPEIIEDLDFSLGRWKSTTPLHNNEGQEVIIYFDFLPGNTGRLTLVEPGGTECTANLTLKAGSRSFDVNQLSDAVCPGSKLDYNPYTFSCAPDEKGYARCIARNKRVTANRFEFRLIKIR